MSEALKGLLGDELYNQVLEKSGLKANEFDLLKNYIPRNRYNEVNSIKKELEDKVTNFESQLTETKSLLGKNEEYKNKYSDLETKFNDFRQQKDVEITNINKRSKLEQKLTSEGAKHVNLLLKEINLDNIKIDGDSLVGADETIKSLKENYKDLFMTENSNTNHTPPAEANNNQNFNPDTSDVLGKIFDNIKI